MEATAQTLTLRVRQSKTATLSTRFESSADLDLWTPLAWPLPAPVDVGGAWERSLSVPIPNNVRRFYRATSGP
jgi:hypothetical protein